MSAGAALLAEARACGLTIRQSEAGKLSLRGPVQPGPELLERLRAGRDAILAELAAEELAASARVPLDEAGMPDAPCRDCGGRGFWRRPLWMGGIYWSCHDCDPLLPGELADACALPASAAGGIS